MGTLYGFRKTLSYMLGITLGFSLIALASGNISSALLRAFPSLEPMLRIFGGAYILWLAWKIFRATYALEEGNQTPVLGFWKGTFLQILNPKGVIFALTLYGTFLAPLAGNLGLILLSVLPLGLLTFSSVALWTLFGAGLRKILANPALQRGVNAVLALLLVYTAVSLVFF